MTYLELIRDADKQLDDGRTTIGEYENMIKPLERQIQPEIIRCGECELKIECCRNIRSGGRKDDDFCSCGRRAERRTDD